LEALLGLLAIPATIRDRTARIGDQAQKNKYLARLLLVGADAFSDQNPELYRAAVREIVRFICNERWARSEIEWRIGRALAIAKFGSSPEAFEKARRLGQNIILAAA
jgi:hypothetical protein